MIRTEGDGLGWAGGTSRSRRDGGCESTWHVSAVVVCVRVYHIY